MKIFTMKHFVRSLCLLVLLIAGVGNAFGQRTAVTGRVTDSEGAVIGGVMVTEKGTQNVTLTDANGNYSIAPSTANPVLEFSFLGFITQEVTVGARTGNVDVALPAEVSELDQVVVVGYGVQRKVSVVGSQSAVDGETIKMPSGNLTNAISGRLAGVVQVSRGAEPGREDNNIWIRGLTNFAENQSSEPLILVDGVERGISQLDSEDIESFTVLKDASATAVYGVRGANGVIIVTTKPGVIGTPKFTFDYYEGVNRFTKSPEMADVYTYMNAANEASLNSGSSIQFSPEYVMATKKAHGVLDNDDPMMFNQYLYPAVDWKKEMFNTWGQNRRANLSVRGGVPSAQYYVSLTYYNEVGLTKNFELQNYNTKMNFDRYNFTSNLNLQPTKRTKIDLGFSGYLSSGHYPQQTSSTLFNMAMETNPTFLPKELPGGLLATFDALGGGRNPYQYLAKGGFKKTLKSQINSNIRATQELDYWNWSEGLSATVMVSFDAHNSRDLNYNFYDAQYWFAGTTDPATGLWNRDVYNADGTFNLFKNKDADNNGQMSFGNGFGADRNIYLEGSLNYDRVFGKHRVSALALYNQRVEHTYNHDNEDNLENSLAYKSRGYAGRVTYSFDDRYLFEANIGINGSENFSPGNRYGVFPAFGVGWVVSNERFWEPLEDVVTYLKLRYTHGYVGSDVVPDRRFAYQAIMGSGYSLRYGPNMDGYDQGWEMRRYGVDVGWSRSLKQDLGIDLSLFRNNLSLTVDIFKEVRDNIFLRRGMLPAYAGFVENPWANLGIAENKGIEAQLEYRQEFNQNVSLTVRGNFTYNKSIIKENDQPLAVYPWLERRGTPINAAWGLVADGIFASQEEIDDSGITNFGDRVQPGDIRYKDLNGDGKIDNFDETIIGRGDVPNIYYGFGFDLGIRRWSFSALFQGTGMADRQINGAAIHPFSRNSGRDNVYANITDRWSADDPTNTDVFYPRLTYGNADGSTNNFRTSSWWQKDVSFLRLKQINISYMLPQSWMDRCFLNSASVYVMATNLFTLTDFKLWDPELNTGNGIAYPNTSTYTLGVKFSF